MEQKNTSENQTLVPIQDLQTSIWDNMPVVETDGVLHSPFEPDPEEEARRRMLALHKAWLESKPREYPSPYDKFKIGVYIRYFNQTKYDNYLDYHKQHFIDTIGLCQNWTLVGFYVDMGGVAPHMENAREWIRLLQDCFDGKVNLIITQKVTNVTRDAKEITLLARTLACQNPPIGIYFINENLFTLASYYMWDMQEEGFQPEDLPPLPDEDEPLLIRGEADD